MIRRLALLALCVIALMTTPGVRADFVSHGAKRLAHKDDRAALQGASKRPGLHSDRRGGAPRPLAGKSALLAVLPKLLPRLALAQSTLQTGPSQSPIRRLWARAARARAPPSVA